MNTQKIKRLVKIFSIITFTFLGNSTLGQRGKLKLADKEYKDFAYVRTSEILLEVVENGYKSVDVLQKLGDAFYFNNQMEEASKWYGELFKLGNSEKQIDTEYYFRYSQALKSIKNYTEFNTWMEKFSELNTSDLRAKSFLSTKNYLSNIEELSKDFELKNLDINSELSDYGTFVYNNELYFSSSRGKGKKHSWNDQTFFNVYVAPKKEEGYGEIIELKDISTKYHESSVAITPDGKTLYFTRSNYYKGRYRSSEKGTNHLKIFRASLNKDGKWDNIESIRFNSNNHSVAHPAINADGTKLYFSSDMEGTLGESDLFVAEIKKDGTLGDPVNLGKYVNTESRETFPFINSDGDLFFASNGFNGLGGLDIYVIRNFDNKQRSGKAYLLQNMAKPINSTMDDFAYFEDEENRIGYVSSNREGGKGYDDIYNFPIIKCKQVVSGTITDLDTKEPLAGATVTLLSEDNKSLQIIRSNEDGSYSFEDLECHEQYLIRVSLEEYETQEKRMTTKSSEDENILDFELKRDQTKLDPCDDLAKILDIPIIYFDFDKYNIRYDAEVELQKVLAVLKKYPSMNIDIRSHTDCRGSAAYNELLSDNRAKSTRQYLIDKGIPANRITAKGYGEYKLLNNCACEPDNNSNCSEKEHQRNRRSQFIITSFRNVECDEN